jgi:hypothetical protein
MITLLPNLIFTTVISLLCIPFKSMQQPFTTTFFTACLYPIDNAPQLPEPPNEYDYS